MPRLRPFPRAALARLAVTLALAATAAAGCGPAAPPRGDAERAGGARRDSSAAARADSARRSDSLEALPRFVRVPVGGPRMLAALRDSIGEAGWRALLRINRVDSAHVRRGDTLIAPRWLADSLATGDPLAFSPFPRAIPALRDTAKALLISLRVQAVAAYDSGRLVHWAPASTGRRDTPTPVGRYHTNWKDRERVSTFDEAWLLRWYVNLHNLEGVSLHQYELPGRPASHSCVRLLEDDAIWFYGWVETWRLAPGGRAVLRDGTPAVVFGAWRWGARAPWKRLPEDAAAASLGADEIAEALRVLAERVAPQFPARAARDTTARARAAPVVPDSAGR